MLKVLDVWKEEDKIKANPVKCIAHLNAALCQLKTNQFKDAKKNCDKGLEIDANNVKGLFRRGQVGRNCPGAIHSLKISYTFG